MASVNVSSLIEKSVKILLRISPLELVCAPGHTSIYRFFPSSKISVTRKSKDVLSLAGICFTDMSKC